MRRPAESFAQIDPVASRFRFGDYFIARSYAALAERFELQASSHAAASATWCSSWGGTDDALVVIPRCREPGSPRPNSKDVWGLRARDPPRRPRAVEAGGRRPHRSALSIADIVAALYGGVLRSHDRRPRPRPLRPLEGPRRARALRRALPATAASTRRASTPTAPTAPARRPPGARAPGRRLLDRLARPGLSLGAGAALAARLRARAARVRAAERRRVQRGLGLGGGHVRRPPPAREPRRHRRRQRPAGARLHDATCSTSRRSSERWRAFGWDVHEVDGHDVGALADTIAGLDTEAGPAARAARADDLRQGRLLHGEPDRVALPADDRRAVRAGACELERGAA